MKLDKTEIKIPRWVLHMAAHRTTNGFQDIFDAIRDEYKNAYKPYRYLEEIHLKFFGETRYKNMDAFWKAYRRARNKQLKV